MAEKRFSKQADLYSKYRPDYPKELYDFIFKQVSQRKNAWDCATGSGQVAQYLSDYFDQVFASDISEEQLRFAPEKPNITYLNTPAEHSGLPDNSFDLITVAQAIHWFNIEQFYDEVRRTARNSGILAVIGYGMIRIDEKVNPIIDDLYERAFEQYFSKNRTYLDQQYQTIPFPFDEIPTPEFGISYECTLKQLEGYFNSWSAIQKIKSEQHYNPVDETVSELQNLLPDTGNISAQFPIFLRLGRVHSPANS